MSHREPSALTAHQKPALLIAAVERVQADGGAVAVLPHAGLDAWQLMEACAQAVAVLAGARARAHDGADGRAAAGMLVGAKGFTVARQARAGEAVRIEAHEIHRLGAISLHGVRAHAGDEELARGELTIAEGAPAGASAP